MSVVIPHITNEPGIRYFMPRFVSIAVGQTIRWLNTDNESHSIIFEKEIPPYDIKIGDVGPNGECAKTFNFYTPRIEYSCAIHPQEKGTIAIYPKQEEEMSNTERLRFLIGFTGNQLPEILSNLSHKPIVYGKNLIPEIAASVSLNKFLDPAIYSILGDPQLYRLQSKNLTIVFWDISSFSNLCNTLINEPILIAGFLTDYFDTAGRIIHNNSGIVDKFIGDGIMALFGFYSDDKTQGALNAVTSALQLRQSFKTIRQKWLEVWSRHFTHYKVDIDVKCGINTGSVLFGLLDAGSRYQITAMGSTVNLASRLESIAETDQIIISSEVKDLIHDTYKTSSIPLPPDKQIRSFPEVDVVYQIKQN